VEVISMIRIFNTMGHRCVDGHKESETLVLLMKLRTYLQSEWGQEYGDLYIHSLIRLHGVGLN
jgi:hypothetical protein